MTWKGSSGTIRPRLVGDIVRNSPALQTYINGYPLAPQVSNDDWHNLDPIHRAVNRFTQTFLDKAVTSFREGLEQEPLGINEKGLQDLANYAGDKFGILNAAMKSGPGLIVQAGTISTQAFMKALDAGAKGIAAAGGQAASELLGMDAQRAEREIGSMIEWAMMRGDIKLGHEPKISSRF
jgi:hypothetical protein